MRKGKWVWRPPPARRRRLRGKGVLWPLSGVPWMNRGAREVRRSWQRTVGRSRVKRYFVTNVNQKMRFKRNFPTSCSHGPAHNFSHFNVAKKNASAGRGFPSELFHGGGA